MEIIDNYYFKKSAFKVSLKERFVCYKHVLKVLDLDTLYHIIHHHLHYTIHNNLRDNFHNYIHETIDQYDYDHLHHYLLITKQFSRRYIKEYDITQTTG